MKIKYIEGYENEYYATKKGRIFSCKSNKYLKPQKCSNGYLMVSLSKYGKVEQLLIHRIIAKAFIPNPKSKKEVNHIDGNITNNCVKNLEWVTKKENARHSIRILGNPKPPTQKGKFGKDHNRSIPIKLIFPDGKLHIFGSGPEFKRKTGLGFTAFAYARKNKLINGTDKYTFTQGNLKGYTLLSNK